MRLLRDYSRQARTYDRTRGAGTSFLAALRGALAGSPGRTLADIGGGTGNYARALAADGWQPLVVDRSPAMLARAAAKGLATLEADAEQLPLADRSFDAAMLVSMLHHTEHPERAISEAARILRPGGRLAIVAFTRENAEDMWLPEYFPSSRPWMAATHPPAATLAAPLHGAAVSSFAVSDTDDASLAALCGRPDLLLDADWRSQTSFFERLERDDAAGLAAGLERLASDVAAGKAPRRPGRATLIAWSAPGA
ncbi:MAG TPA: class I SAM-dependent methyltransferase [Solirubrobacteraceae bacterium]|nr:class I SAM-dependent methyltransferase [Solirubrobacteraceae bacterium]